MDYFKKFVGIILLLIIFINILNSCATIPSTRLISLNEAIIIASDGIQNNINKETRIAVLNMESQSNLLSQYIIDELNSIFVNNKNIIVVDRHESEIILRERNFQLSAEVNDETAQSIGKTLGVHSIITGAIVEVSDGYRLRLKMLNVETRRIEALPSVSSINRRDNQINFYLKNVREEERQRVAAEQKEERQRVAAKQKIATENFFSNVGSFFKENWIWITGLVGIGLSLGIGIPVTIDGWNNDELKLYTGAILGGAGFSISLGLFIGGIIAFD